MKSPSTKKPTTSDEIDEFTAHLVRREIGRTGICDTAGQVAKRLGIRLCIARMALEASVRTGHAGSVGDRYFPISWIKKG